MKKHILYIVLFFAFSACNQNKTDTSNKTQTEPVNQTQTNPVNQTQTNPGNKTPTDVDVPKKQKAQVVSNIQLNFEKTFEGQIDGKHDIVMHITSTNGKITGDYFYTVSKTKIKVEGSLNNQGNLSLTESNQFGTKTGLFTGTMMNNKIEGIWSNTSGDLRLPFVAIESK